MVSHRITGLASAVAAALALATPAAADPGDPAPDPPPPPVAVDPAAPTPSGAYIPGIGAPMLGLGLLAQNGQPSDPNPGALGAPPVSGMDLTTVLGQNAVPSPPGGGPGTIPNLNPFNNQYGVQQCLKPSAPGQCQEFGIDPGDENADVPGRKFLGRYVDMYRAGLLRGGSLAQYPKEQLGEPLPGTAPPPGTRIPPGLDEFQPDPADGAPPAPGAPPPPPVAPLPAPPGG